MATFPAPTNQPSPLSPLVPLNSPMVGFASPFDHADGQNRDIILEAIRTWASANLLTWSTSWQTFFTQWLIDVGNYVTANAISGYSWRSTVTPILNPGPTIVLIPFGVSPLRVGDLVADTSTSTNYGVITALVDATHASVTYIGSLQGVPGPNTIPTDTAIAGFVNPSGGYTVGTSTKTALNKTYENLFTPQMFGGTGDGVTDDTIAVQAAITAALTSTNPANGERPPYVGTNGTVFLPLGTYLVTELQVPGTVAFVGVGGGTYAKSTLYQKTAGAAIVRLKADTDGQSNSSTFDNVAFKSATGTSAAGVAQVITDVGIVSNSVYFRNCWFKSPENWAIWMTQGDDLQIAGCTFDVAAFNAIRLGSAANRMTNASISNNTFYNVSLRHIQADNVAGLTITGNRVYGVPANAGSVFLHCGDTPVALQNTAISGNEFNGITELFHLSTTGGSVVAINGNTATGVSGDIISIGGGGIYYALVVTGNAITAAGAYSSAPFTAPGCGLQQSIISHNTIMAGAATALLFNMSDARVTGNLLNLNSTVNFTANNNFATPANNGA